MTPRKSDAETVRQLIREGCGQIARHGSERRQSSCCGGLSAVDADHLARKIGYRVEDLAALPDHANIGLSCGNPGALAALCPGEVLLDLGSGAGFDAFVAGLAEIRLNAKPGYVNTLVAGQDPLYLKIIANLPAGTQPGDYITSLEITGRKRK